MKTGNNNQRILWIDMAKGYGIILVIIGHWNIPYLTDYLYAFHIPLFFFLSGVVFSLKYDFVSFLKTKVRHIVVPYFCLGSTVVLADLLFSYGINFGLLDIVKKVACLFFQERYTTLWFFACLLILNILMYPLVKFVKIHPLSDFIVFVICLCGILLWRNGIFSLPWNIDAALVVLPFFYVGHKLRDVFLSSQSLIICKKRYVIFFVFILGFLVWLFNSWNIASTGEKVDIYYSNMNIELLTFLTASIGIVMIVLLSMIHINPIIIYIGENSLLYFVWHQTILLPLLCRIYWGLGFMQLSDIETNIIKCVSVVLTIVIITILNMVIKRSKLKFVLGQ